MDVVRAAPSADRKLAPEVATLLREQMDERVAAATPKKKVKPLKVKPEPASSSQAPPTKPGKPKPQANVMLSDLFDFATPKPTAKAALGAPPPVKGSGPAVSSTALPVGLTAQAGSQAARKAAAKAEALAKAKADAEPVLVSGLGVTQRHRKEKEGPKKVRLSKMKKTILRELMVRHGLLPASSGSGNETEAAAAETAPGTNEDAAAAAAASGETAQQTELSAVLTDDAEEEILEKAYEQLYPDGDPDRDAEDEEADESELAREEGEPLPDDASKSAKASEVEDSPPREAGGEDHQAKSSDEEVQGEPEEGEAEADVAGGSKDALRRPDAAFSNPWVVREYVEQLVLPEVTDACHALLQELIRFQERLYLKDPVKANTKKRYMCGLREVIRSLKTNKAKAVIVAHNVERIESENGLDDVVAQLMQLSKFKQEWVFDEATKKSSQELVPREEPIPIIYAFTRKQLAKALKRSVRTSVVAVLNYDGAGDQFSRAVTEAKAARRRWQELTAPWLAAGQRQPERLLVQRTVDGKQQWMDPLQLHAQIGAVEE